MNNTGFTSLERVLMTLGHKEPDRVPFFLLVNLHGARELGMSIEDYFSKAENMAEGQIRMRERYGHDCLYAFSYASIEHEAFGGKTLYFEDGPPNAGTPVIHALDDINHIQCPRIKDSPCLSKVLEATTIMKERIGDEAPIIGVTMSPFSLPVMQMGFEPYLNLILNSPDHLERLMVINEEFCVGWANAQLEAGATAICYFDPVSSSTVITPEQYRQTGFKVAQRTLARINGPTATHFASGRCLPVIEDVINTKTNLLGISVSEDLAEVKAAAAGRLTLFGNLNGVEMRRWTPEQTEEIVKEAISKGAIGGGFILADNHGEIPWQVPETVLEAIANAVHKWGRYPLDW